MSQLAHTHPRRATEILDASFRFYRAHFGDLLVVSALLLVPLALVGALAPEWIGRLIQLLDNWMYLIVQAVVAVIVAAALERDQALSAGEAFREFGGRAGTIIVVSIVTGLMIGLGFILLIVPGVIALAWTAAALPIAAIEGLPTGQAITRSRELARGQIGHVLGTMLLAWVIVLALMFGIALALGAVASMFSLPERLSNMIVELVMVPLFPLIGVAMTMLYYDLRVRNEGADVMAMVDALPDTP
ncbi:MAG: hypothetical protein ACJ79A_08240 [Gemmatimonadaceae bacterium]